MFLRIGHEHGSGDLWVLKQVCEMLFENEKNGPQIHTDCVTLINADKQSAISYQLSILLLKTFADR